VVEFRLIRDARESCIGHKSFPDPNAEAELIAATAQLAREQPTGQP
jgi:hypothetical protein